MDDLAVKIKRLLVPIIIGVFVIIFGVLGFLYIQEWQQQGTLRNTIASSEGSLAAGRSISDEFQNEYDEVIASVPAIYSIAQETEFKNEVKQLVRVMIDMKTVAGTKLFPSVDVNDSAIFAIKSLDWETRKMGSATYRDYNFDVALVGITYEEVTGFIEALEDIVGLETLSLSESQITEVELGFNLKSKFRITTINSEDQ